MRRRVNKTLETSFIEFDRSISNCANISGNVNSGIIVQLLSRFRRCLVKKTATGEVTIAYLNNNNSNLYEDGSAADLTGREGDVMVYMPEFYYKYEKVDNNKFRYYLALGKADNNYIKVPQTLLGAYQANVVSNKLYSRSGTVPTRSVSQMNFKVYAAARGTGYGIINYEQHCALALLFYAKYGTRNSQEVLGAGNKMTEGASGSTNALGNRDTVKTTTTHTSFLGIEAIINAMDEWVDGVVIDNYIWKITNPETGALRQVTAVTGTGLWIKEIMAANGPYFDVIPIETGGSNTTYYSDYYNSANSSSRALARSGSSANIHGGVSTTYANYATTWEDYYYGSRLAFRGVVKQAASISEFKNISAIV